MKSLKLFLANGLAVCALLLSSCGGSADKTDEKTSTDTTAAQPAETKPASTIVTTPRTMMTVTHKVKDFSKWLASYEAHDSFKLANGIHNYVVARLVNDTSMVMVTTKADDLAKARAFAKDPSLKQAMQKGGVISAPTFQFNEIVWQDTSNISTSLRARTTFNVKDWDAWRKSFDSARQVPTDNGLAVRAYGHDVDDNKKVILVVAVLDTAKANAYFNSDMLKQRRAASGVIGTPVRTLYNVVKRY